MSQADRRAGYRDAIRAYRDKGFPVAPRELVTVPPCRACGKVPKQYARFDDGAIECIGNDRPTCLLTDVTKGT